MPDILLLSIYAFIGSVAGLIGGLVLLFKKDWAKKLATVSVPLAAGVLLSISLLDLVPEAVEEAGETAFVVILAVFVILFILERFFFFIHHHQDSDHSEDEEGHNVHSHSETSVFLIIFGDTIHNLLDGIVIGAAFVTNPALGLVVSLSTFLHETPHEIADFGILLSKGWSRKKAFIANFLSALATFPGAILTYYFADRVHEGVGIMLAIAAGFFLYVATTDFLPEATHAPKKYIGRQAGFLLLGIFAIVFIRMIFPEVGH